MSTTDFSGSYPLSDVRFLLKPVTLAPVDTALKEQLIQSGARHYSEMLSPERQPSAAYLSLYHAALERHATRLGGDIASLAAALDGMRPCGKEIVIISLARAGTPIGILLSRALARLGRKTAHYSISIIRDRGIDAAALAHIAARHDPEDAIFVDGWTGKGAISGELRRSLAQSDLGFEPFLTVIADPGGRAELAATGDDYLIASGLLNSVVSGLVSRSILNEDVVKPGEFHACVHYRDLAAHDLSNAFVDRIDAEAQRARPKPLDGVAAERPARVQACDELVSNIMARFDLSERNRIKPGIAEATRALLRRLPDRLLVRDAENDDVAHLLLLAEEQGIPVETLPAECPFRAVTIIKTLGGD